ncbi:MAG: hypothetical protein COV72_02055 [Candidatus Omnitrophica bacterium CG11_big_fil_rev_8_21_14_0_20_42_13]|uniref:Dehydrogenase E1 component domain-containing protein n=1 Tax=Candidatus Ghiorseimicrobium undicola TaxID=1974746 RepID=A0A2H0LZ06_9BACT|nr:MAG: hypothetical protein COV72_02055 [Candidatus Omnitrophica bacterium CG11_big_fil_rev_8_21_14_0_20_42_13]
MKPIREIKKFESEISRLYEAAKIRAPVHLSKGNELHLVKIFKRYYKPGDWIFSTHRNHYHWLLSGRKPARLKKQILAGHSMHVFDKKFFTSSIVAGSAPIALGVAMGLKLSKSPNKVLCFMGDMASECGIAHECVKYAQGYDLPIVFVIEDDNFSVRARTKEVWGKLTPKANRKRMICKRYRYKRLYPHAGTGKYVMF